MTTESGTLEPADKADHGGTHLQRDRKLMESWAHTGQLAPPMWWHSRSKTDSISIQRPENSHPRLPSDLCIYTFTPMYVHPCKHTCMYVQIYLNTWQEQHPYSCSTPRKKIKSQVPECHACPSKPLISFGTWVTFLNTSLYIYLT